MEKNKYSNEVAPSELFLKEPGACYEKAETDLLREALKKSFTERFLFTTRLYKLGMMMKTAKITHQPFSPTP